MKITTTHSTGQADVGLLRMLSGERRTLVVLCPWGVPLVEVFRRLSGQLTDEEHRAVAEAFGLEGPPEAS